MRRLLFVVLMTVCSVSWAEWKFLNFAMDGDEDYALYFYDKSTIRKNGAISQMWVMKSYTKVQTDLQGTNYWSTKVFEAYNCRKETSALVSLIYYSKPDGKGSIVFSGTRQEKEWEWEPIVPGSISEILWKTACGKK